MRERERDVLCAYKTFVTGWGPNPRLACRVNPQVNPHNPGQRHASHSVSGPDQWQNRLSGRCEKLFNACIVLAMLTMLKSW